MKLYLPILTAIDQPLPHTVLLQKLAIVRGLRPDNYSSENDSEWLTLNPIEDGLPKPITMELVRQLPSILSLQKTRDWPRIVTIQGVDLSKVECQHALLKSLEEQPAETVLVISCLELAAVLPTIQSRCEVVKLETTPVLVAFPTMTPLLEQLLAAGTPADIFRLSDAWKERDAAGQALKATLAVERGRLEAQPTVSQIRRIKAVESCYRALQKNANVRLQLEKLAQIYLNN